MNELFSSTPKSIPEDQLTNRHQLIFTECMNAYVGKCKGSQRLKDRNKNQLSTLLDRTFFEYKIKNMKRNEEETNVDHSKQVDELKKSIKDAEEKAKTVPFYRPDDDKPTKTEIICSTICEVCSMITRCFL